MFVFVATKSDLIAKAEHAAIVASAERFFDRYQPKGCHITSAVTRDGVDELFLAAADLYGAPVKSARGPRTAELTPAEQSSCC